MATNSWMKGQLVLELSEEEIARLFPPAPRTLNLREIMRLLGVPRGHKRSLNERLETMVASGKLHRRQGKRYGVPNLDRQTIGSLSLTRQGYGFILQEGDGPDLYVSAANLGGAMHRDRVRAEVFDGRDGRLASRVLAVLDHGVHTCIGVAHLGRRGAWLAPRDERLPGRIPMEEPRDIRNGDMVAAEFLEWPSPHKGPGLVRVIKCLARDNAVAAETDVVIYDLGLPLGFSVTATKQSEAIPDDIGEEEITRRNDLRALPLVTIDPQTARDFDDAVHAEETPGGWRLTVAVADVGHFVPEGSAIDEDAYGRGTSVYLPDRVLPMLPDRLSGELCSLLPQVDRLAMTMQCTIRRDGSVEGVSLSEAVIRSHRRFAYDRVARLLGLHPDSSERAEPEDDVEAALLPALGALLDATRTRRKRRKKSGYLALDLSEPSVRLDASGDVVGIVHGVRHEAHLMVEEAMLIANEAVARFLIDAELDGLFRVHDAPSDEALDRFRMLSEPLGARLGPKKSVKQLSSFVRSLGDHPHGSLIQLLLLRSMSKADYRAEVGEHFGLGLDAYLHFTSPIRRYPDLIVHRLVKGYLNDEPMPGVEALREAARHTSRRERVALEAERDVINLYKTVYMSRFLGDPFQGVVVGLSNHGAFVLLDDVQCEGFLPLSIVSERTKGSRALRGSLFDRQMGCAVAMGDRVSVRVVRTDARLRQVELTWLGDRPFLTS